MYLAARREGTFERLYTQQRLKKDYRDLPALRAAFLEQARRCQLLRHPNAVSVLDFGEDEIGAFVISEYIDGVSMGELLASAARGPLPVDVCLRIARDVAEALHAAHELEDEHGVALGLVHGDVSAQSIVIGFDGGARLADFGFAAALAPAALTAAHSEQTPGAQPDRRADLFALGVVLWELLAGKRLVDRTGERVTSRTLLDEAAARLAASRNEAPSELVELVSRMLAAEPAARPATAKDVALALETILTQLGAGSAPTETATLLAERFATLREERRIQLSEARLLASMPPERPRPVSIRPDPALSTKVRQRQLIALAALVVLMVALLAKLADRFTHPTKPSTAAHATAAPNARDVHKP